MSQGEKVSWPIINCPALHYWWNFFFCLEYLGWYEGGFHVSTIPLDYRPSIFLFIFCCPKPSFIHSYSLRFIRVQADVIYFPVCSLSFLGFFFGHCRLFVSLPSRSSLFLAMKPVTIYNRSLLISWVTYCSLGLTSL